MILGVGPFCGIDAGAVHSSPPSFAMSKTRVHVRVYQRRDASLEEGIKDEIDNEDLYVEN